MRYDAKQVMNQRVRVLRLLAERCKRIKVGTFDMFLPYVSVRAADPGLPPRCIVAASGRSHRLLLCRDGPENV